MSRIVPLSVILARFHDSYVPVTESGCWLWLKQTHFGYGVFNVGQKHYRAHRWYFQHLHGPIDPSLQCDHLCRVRSCVNPAHIRIVTPRENTLCGDTVSAKCARKTHCIHGHEFTPENTGYETVKGRKWQRRFCRACSRIKWHTHGKAAFIVRQARKHLEGVRG